MLFPNRIRSIRPSDLVLEVVAGAEPHPRTNVLVEMSLPRTGRGSKSRGARAGGPALSKVVCHADGPLPFANRQFDYVICCDVLERVERVDQLLRELQRVATAGYLEFPTVYWEYMYDLEDHASLLLRAGNVVRWMPKAEAGLRRWRNVTRFFRKTLERGHVPWLQNLGPFMFQGFEWKQRIWVQRAHSLRELAFRKSEVSVPWAPKLSVPEVVPRPRSPVVAALEKIRRILARFALNPFKHSQGVPRVDELIPEPEPDPLAEAHEAWRAANGDKTLRLDYALAADSIVLDVGGYEGQWASDIFARYCCTVHVFEPLPEFAEQIRKRFQGNAKIVVHSFGLAGRTRKAKMGAAGDGSSLFLDMSEASDVDLVSAEDFLRSGGFGRIALMKINIEGAEYELLECLIDKGLIRNIENIQVQFHELDDSSADKMAGIQDKLRKTHEPTYQYAWVWENWRIRE